MQELLCSFQLQRERISSHYTLRQELRYVIGCFPMPKAIEHSAYQAQLNGQLQKDLEALRGKHISKPVPTTIPLLISKNP